MKKIELNRAASYLLFDSHVLFMPQDDRSTKPFLWAHHKYIKITVVLVAIIGILIGGNIYHAQQQRAAVPASPFIASVDTMKVSRDTDTRPLSEQEISNIVDTTAGLNVNYITVDTQWNYPDYMLQWINAIRKAGRHVWFRTFPNQWENANGTTGLMTPSQYIASEQNFILANPSFFRAGDILDPCPEAEQGLYWKATYGEDWTSNAPNAATSEYNNFLRQTTDTADAALHQNHITGVITTIRSTNSFFATHPQALEPATVNKFGYITVDSYPDQDTQDPNVAAQAWVEQLKEIEAIRHVPIVIGEMGYSNHIPVNDAIQQAVLKAEFSQFQSLSYVVGVNYWVGAGSDTAGGYTYILAQKDSGWVLRPAAYDLAAFYFAMLANKNK